MSARVAVAALVAAVAIAAPGCATQGGAVRVASDARHGPRYQAGAIVIGAGLALAVVGAAMAVATLQHGCSIAQGDCSSAELRENQFWAGFGLGIAGNASAALVGPALMISNAWQRPVEPR